VFAVGSISVVSAVDHVVLDREAGRGVDVELDGVVLVAGVLDGPGVGGDVAHAGAVLPQVDRGVCDLPVIAGAAHDDAGALGVRPVGPEVAARGLDAFGVPVGARDAPALDAVGVQGGAVAGRRRRTRVGRPPPR
jgi:hypothetical protein